VSDAKPLFSTMEIFSMKKTLIALAAVAATAAYAQSSVTVYGVVDAGYNSKSWKADGGIKAKGTGIVDGALAGSRFGFRGVEDLGGGLKAEFVIEQGLSVTSAGLTNARTGTSGFQIDNAETAALSGRSATSLNRQSYVGVSGGFGAVRIGYQYTNVYELSTLSGYMLGAEGVHGSDFAHVAGSGYVGGTRANAITYISPNFNGFSAQFQYGAGTGLQSFEHNTALPDDQFEAKRTSLMGKYAAGPLSVALAYTSYKNGTTAAGAATGPATVTAKLTQLGASYDFGMAKVGFTYNDGKNDVVGAGERKVDAYSLGVTVPFGATSVVASYHDIDEKGAAGVAVTKGDGFQIGVVHNLSKRTAAYAFYGRNNFDTVAAPAALTNLKQSDVTVGVRHSF